MKRGRTVPRSRARARLGLARLVPVLLALAAIAACGKETSSDAPRNKVLLIGLDGAEWDLIQPMVDAGQLPHFARLMNQGVHGKLRSLEPAAKSPAIWTTIATGKSPEEHGIDTFVDEQGGLPLTQNLRKVRALWNILSAVDRSVGVVGWLMSWPAEEVNGFVVSDYLQYAAKGSTRIMHRTFRRRSMRRSVARWSSGRRCRGRSCSSSWTHRSTRRTWIQSSSGCCDRSSGSAPAI